MTSSETLDTYGSSSPFTRARISDSVAAFAAFGNVSLSAGKIAKVCLGAAAGGSGRGLAQAVIAIVAMTS